MFSFTIHFKKTIIFFLVFCLIISASLFLVVGKTEEKYIKWVDFNIPKEAMSKAIKIDIDTYSDKNKKHIKFIEILAYLGTEYGGKWEKYKSKDIDKLIDKLENGKTITELCEGKKYFEYYLKSYTAVLGGFVGEYEIETEKDGTKAWEKKYGIKVFSPIASGFYYAHSDDFGNSRSYGYKRKHLGHDMMADVGTPVIAIESGIVEVMGWNKYGGWRLVIRSFDGQRSYYYAHLRANRPYAEGLEKGDVIMAGGGIGCVGRAGGGIKENTNGMKISHLHVGMQLIFDESQKEGINQIWIDLYDISKLLANHKSKTIRNPETKEHTRSLQFREAVPGNKFDPLKQPPAEEPETEDAAAEDSFAENVSAELIEDMQLPILMYHSILKNKTGTYVITPDALEQDLKYFQESGYTTVVTQDIVDYVHNKKTLPEKPVMLTFDDGYFNNVHYAQPLLQKYNMQAVIYIVGEFCDRAVKEGEENPAYSPVMWDRVAEMAISGVWDIQSHSYAMHNLKKRNGVMQKRGESDTEYEKALHDDFSKITEELFKVTGTKPTSFAYPFGCLDEKAELTLKQLGYKTTVCSQSGIARLVQGEPDCLYNLKRLLRTPGRSAERLIMKGK